MTSHPYNWSGRAANSRARSPLHTLVVRYLSVILCLLTLAGWSDAQSGWVRQRTGSFAWLHSLFFVDRNRGWAVGSKGTLLATKDGGNTWEIRRAPTPDIIRDIYFVDDSHGWLVCEKNAYDLKIKDEPRTYLMRTDDAGANWMRINIKGIDIDASLTRTLFTSQKYGWTFGEGGLIFTTRDEGLNWTRIVSPTRHLLLGGMFVDEYRGWLVGAGATIIQTSDGGETWHQSILPQASESGVRFAAASFVNNRVGWVVGSAGNIYHTENGGRTWEAQHSGVDTDLFDVKFIDPLEGWAVGTEGTVVHTYDGGTHWNVERSDTQHPLERVFFVDRAHGWAVGFGGTIISFVGTEAPRLTQQVKQ